MGCVRSETPGFDQQGRQEIRLPSRVLSLRRGLPGMEAAAGGFRSWANRRISLLRKYIMKLNAIISLLAIVLLSSTAAVAQEKKSCSFDLVGTWKAQL